MMTLWERFRGWIREWFIHDSAAKSGVTISMPSPPQTPPALPAPAAPAPAAPAPAPAPAAPAPVLLPANNPVQATLSTAENVVKLLGTAVSALKSSGLLGGGNSRTSLPALSNDSADTDTSSSDEGSSIEPDFINDSSDVID